MHTKAWTVAVLFTATIGFLASGVGAQTPASPTPSSPAPASTIGGEAIFTQHCKACHEPPIQHAPSRATIAAYPRANVVAILTDGEMAPMAKGLSKDEIAAVAAYLTPSQDTSASPRRRRAMVSPVGTDLMCAANPPIQTSPIPASQPPRFPG